MKHQPVRPVSSADKLSVSYKSRDLISNVLSGFADAVVITDQHFNITGWNPAAEKFYGKTAGDTRGKPLFEIINISFSHTNLSEALTKFHEKGYWNGEIIYDRKDNHRFFLNISATVIYNDAAVVAGIVIVTRNITERKKPEEQLLNEKIKQQRLLNKTAISAQEAERDNISKELHDNVNQLLTSTKPYIHMARKQPDKAADMLEKAEEYQLMAVEEIRKLSKKLNSSLVKVLGLKNSIQEIVHSMQQINDLI
jgi:PAS domain S-box-containing protein